MWCFFAVYILVGVIELPVYSAPISGFSDPASFVLAPCAEFGLLHMVICFLLVQTWLVLPCNNQAFTDQYISPQELDQCYLDLSSRLRKSKHDLFRVDVQLLVDCMRASNVVGFSSHYVSNIKCMLDKDRETCEWLLKRDAKRDASEIQGQGLEVKYGTNDIRELLAQNNDWDYYFIKNWGKDAESGGTRILKKNGKNKTKNYDGDSAFQDRNYADQIPVEVMDTNPGLTIQRHFMRAENYTAGWEQADPGSIQDFYKWLILNRPELSSVTAGVEGSLYCEFAYKWKTAKELGDEHFKLGPRRVFYSKDEDKELPTESPGLRTAEEEYICACQKYLRVLQDANAADNAIFIQHHGPIWRICEKTLDEREWRTYADLCIMLDMGDCWTFTFRGCSTSFDYLRASEVIETSCQIPIEAACIA